MRVAILGCGPSGLFAAHAVAQSGHTPVIFSKRRKSHMFGAQYLHSAIPGLTSGEPRRVVYRLQGTPEGYRTKIYGEAPNVAVSPVTLPVEHPAWDIREAYDRAWEAYSGAIEPAVIDPEWLDAHIKRAEFPATISTVPLPPLCVADHAFPSARIWALGDAPERGQSVGVACPEDTVICNGEKEPGWYRVSNIYGHKTVEWPERAKPPIPGVAEVRKPIRTNCDCLAGSDVHPMGRYGSWTKGVLADDVYWDACELVEALDR